jgi:uncharacterized membrane protein (GlpM family)
MSVAEMELGDQYEVNAITQWTAHRYIHLGLLPLNDNNAVVEHRIVFNSRLNKEMKASAVICSGTYRLLRYVPYV